MPDLGSALMRLDMDLSRKMFSGVEADYLACKVAAKSNRLGSSEIR